MKQEPLQKAFEREWIRLHGPPKQLLADEGTGWASDATGLWAEECGIDLKISPGQAHTRIAVVERRHQILRKAISVFMLENKLTGLEGVHMALNWVVQAINGHTFVNGFTPTQLALGREPNLPGLLSDERTGPLQLQMTEQQRLHQKLELKFSAQRACAKAEVDVKLRRALLRRFTGKDEELHPGERCLYWRESNNKFHTVQWRGPAVVVAVQRDPETGAVDVYWIAHNTVLLRAGRQHVRKIPDDEGRVDGGDRATAALDGLRQRRVVRMIDLNKTNKRTLDELDPETSDYSPSIAPAPAGTPLVDEPDRLEELPSPDELGGLDSLREEQPTEVEMREDQPLQAEDAAELLLRPDSPLAGETENQELRQISQDEPMSEPSHGGSPAAQTDDAGELLDQLPPVPEDQDLQDAVPRGEQASSSATGQIDPSFIPVPEESFCERRKRFDLQETIMPRIRAPEHRRLHEPKSKKARTESDVDVELYGFDFAQMALPSGWHYDSKSNEFFLGDVQDFWSFEDGFLVRNHVVGRCETFHAGEAEFPIPAEQLQSVHGLSLRSGSRTIYANGEQPIAFEEQWLGKTLFPLTKEAAESRGTYFIGDLTNKLGQCKKFRGRGHIWTAVGVPKKKQVKESADLSERKMTLEDRLSFMEGKKAELMSIFENGVWEVELDPQKVDHSRVMRARFVLKWTHDSSGKPRAKARLVLQGFSDPDLLKGGLDTSSPTLNRTSRQVLLSLSVCKGWARWVADVATAFLQGDPQQRVLWAKIPRDACEIIGVPSGTLMRLIKPIYGQADAPRQWFIVAKRRLESIGYQAHPLDCCLFRYFGSDGSLLSLIGLHVDDMLGTGLESSEEYQAVKQRLKSEFNFKHWTEESSSKSLEFCGCKLESMNDAAGTLRLQQDEYIKNVKPVTCKDQDGDRPLTSAEVTSLRALLGALQWPATQSSPHLSASVSLLCGEVAEANVDTVKQANKTLRFAKQNSDASLQFHNLGQIEDLCMVAMSDAAWGVRRNSQSQGGYVVLLAHKDALSGKMDQKYIILDWRSSKLPRVSRSSLNAESQACAGAMDALEFLLLFWHGCLHQDFDLRQVNDIKVETPSALVVDAKALFDSLKAEVPQLQGDKRTKIEVMVTKQKMIEMSTALRWVSSEVQLADGVTKTAARQLMADRLRTHEISLQADSSFQASKKKSMAERQASARRNAVSRLVHKQSLAYAILTAQIVPVRGEGDVLDYVIQPEVILSVLVILFSTFGFLLARALWSMCFSSSTMASSERLAELSSSTMSMSTLEAEVQTESSVNPETLVRLRRENIKLRSQVDDAEEAIAEWQSTFDTMDTKIREMQSRNQDLVNMRDFMASELESSQDACRTLRRELQEVQNREMRLRLHLENFPIPEHVVLSRRGRSYHTSFECQGLQSADRSGLEEFPSCSFCATRVMLANRLISQRAAAISFSPNVKDVAHTCFCWMLMPASRCLALIGAP